MEVKKIIMLLTIMQLAITSSVLAVVDVTPPWARLNIVGATESNGVNYVTNTEVEVEIYAHDDMCADTEIEYYISDTAIDTTKPLDATAEGDSLWKPYTPGLKVNITIDDLTATNTLYAAFRDKTGNTSIIYKGSEVEYTINYNVNEGTGTIPSGTGYHGMAYVVTNQMPKRTGYYFVGWSTSPTAPEASYAQGDIISAEAFNGSDKVIDLYAVWSKDTESLPFLSEKVQIGDYVDYPVYYENMYENGRVTTKRGWRVIGVEDDGTVNLVSAGIPLTYYHVGSTDTSVTALTTNFFVTEFDESVTKQKFVKNGFLGYGSMQEAFTNKYTEMNGTVPKVRSITKEDILSATGFPEMLTAYDMDLSNPKYEGLWKIDEVYWVASAYNASNLWFVYNYGYVDYINSYEYGVRPVVSLKSTVRAAEKDSAGRWQIEISE